MGKQKQPSKASNFTDIIPPSMTEITEYVNALYEESTDLNNFIQRSLGRMELLSVEINFPELKYYISLMKSFSQKYSNTESEKDKQLNATIQAFRRDNESLKSDNLKLKAQIKEQQNRLEFVEKQNREQGAELKLFKSGGPKQTGAQRPSQQGQTADAQAIKTPQISAAKDAPFQASSSNRKAGPAQKAASPPANKAAPSASLVTPPVVPPTALPSIFKEDLSLNRPKSVLKKTTFAVSGNTTLLSAQSTSRLDPISGRDLHKRTSSAGPKTVSEISEVYQFKAAEDADGKPRPRGVSFKPIREESSVDSLPRRGADNRNRTPSTRGRSQSVHHDRSQSLKVVTQHHEAETEEDYLTITHLRPNYLVLYLTAYNQQFVQAMQDIEKAPAVGVDAEYKLERGVNVPTYLQVADEDKAYVFNLKLICSSPQSETMLKAIWEFLTSKKPKIGQSLAHDLVEISQFIIPRLRLKTGPQIVNCWSLEEKLFLWMPSRTLGLTHLAYRHLGKYMRKKQKEISAGGQRTITNELQMEYVALDGLAPLV